MIEEEVRGKQARSAPERDVASCPHIDEKGAREFYKTGYTSRFIHHNRVPPCFWPIRESGREVSIGLPEGARGCTGKPCETVRGTIALVPFSV